MGRYFGTDGFRGKAGIVLTAEHAFKTGRYLGWYYGKKHLDDKARIVIGKDTRRSSYLYESALAAGITSSGADTKRHILLRHKPSTNQWFVEDQMLLAMIRTPKSQDPWA